MGIYPVSKQRAWIEKWMPENGLTMWLKKGIQIHRKTIPSISSVAESYPHAKAIFNCTGLGSFSLGEVQDKTMYPTRGQIMLVETPEVPLTRMYFRSPQRVNKDTNWTACGAHVLDFSARNPVVNRSSANTDKFTGFHYWDGLSINNHDFLHLS